MKALEGAFNQEKALVGAFSVIMKTDCGTDGSFYSTSFQREHEMYWSAVLMPGRWCRRCYRIPEHSSRYTAQRHLIFYENLSNPSLDSDHSTAGRCCRAGLVTAGEQQKVKVSTDQDREAARPRPSSQYPKHPENVSFFSHKDCLLKMATLTYILHVAENI